MSYSYDLLFPFQKLSQKSRDAHKEKTVCSNIHKLHYHDARTFSRNHNSKAKEAFLDGKNLNPERESINQSVQAIKQLAR